MRKNAFFLLLFYFILPGSLPANAENPEPTLHSEAFVSCTLPAPGNLQRSFPNPVQVTYTWNSVPGAWGYRIVVTDMNSANFTIHTTPNTTITLNATPGHTYNVKFYSMCSDDPGDFSQQYAEDEFLMPGIVIELILENSGCGTVSGLVNNDSPTPATTFKKEGGWGLNEDYFIKMTNPGGGQTLLLKFKLVQKQTGIVYELLEVGNPAGCILEGISLSTAAYVPPPAFTGNGRLTFDNKVFYIRFLDFSEFEFSFEPDQNGNTFANFAVYQICTSLPRKTPQFDGSDHAWGLGDIATVVNPFFSDLTIYFNEYPAGPVKTRLFDLQGIPKIETVIEPDQMSDFGYSLQTASLPSGMYFLQMEMPSGELITRKVLKI